MKLTYRALVALALLGTAYAATAQHWSTDPYLAGQVERIRLAATKCPGEGDRSFVIGTRPDVNRCVTVSYRASCPGPNNTYAEGYIRNYVGGASCYGDAHPMNRQWLTCEPKDMKVWVTDVTYCD